MDYDTNKLLPGYTEQGFALARCKMLDSAILITNSNKVLGYGARVVFHLSCKATEYIETPFRLIESFALTIINMIGSIFSQGCRNNLEYSAKVPKKDAVDCFMSAAIVSIPFVLGFVLGWKISGTLFHTNAKSIKLKEKNDTRYNQIKNDRATLNKNFSGEISSNATEMTDLNNRVSKGEKASSRSDNFPRINSDDENDKKAANAFSDLDAHNNSSNANNVDRTPVLLPRNAADTATSTEYAESNTNALSRSDETEENAA